MIATPQAIGNKNGNALSKATTPTARRTQNNAANVSPNDAMRSAETEANTRNLPASVLGMRRWYVRKKSKNTASSVIWRGFYHKDQSPAWGFFGGA